MDSFATFAGNCRLSKFDSKVKFGKNSQNTNEIDGVTRKEFDSQKPLKYYTQNPSIAPGTPGELGPRGLSTIDGFGLPSCVVSSNTKPIVTKQRVRNELKGLPFTTSGGLFRGSPNVSVEDAIRPVNEINRKTCNTNSEGNYYDRSFYIFDNLPVRPNQGEIGFYPRNMQGEDTRNMLKSRNIKK